MLLRDHVTVLAGAGPGVGRSLALAAAREGSAVVVAARSEERVHSIVAEVEARGGAGLALTVDLTDSESCAALAARVKGEFGRVDAVANTGFWTEPERSLRDTDESTWHKAFDVNVVGAWRLIEHLIPLMPAGRGSIVLTGSQAGYKPSDTLAVYAAAKAALVSLVRSAAKQYGPAGVRVNSVVPGSIGGEGLRAWAEQRAAELGTTTEHEMAVRAAKSPLGRIVTPEEIAEAIVFTLSPLASGITGTFIDLDCGQHLSS